MDPEPPVGHPFPVLRPTSAPVGSQHLRPTEHLAKFQRPFVTSLQPSSILLLVAMASNLIAMASNLQ